MWCRDSGAVGVKPFEFEERKRISLALSANIAVRSKPRNERGLFALSAVVQDEVLLTYDGPVLNHPTRLSIQIDDDRHIEGTDDSNAYLNHSCDANAYVDWTALCLRAKRGISAGEEITCNYFTTDYELHEKLRCTCSSKNCKGEIGGFKYLSDAEKEELRPWLPPFLLRKMIR